MNDPLEKTHSDASVAASEKSPKELLDVNMQLSHALTELKRSQRQLIEQSRMNALGQMTSGITHDFNNALMPILGLSEHLLHYPNLMDNRDEALKIVKEIHDAAQHAANLIRRLSSFYRPSDHNEREAVHFREMLDEVIAIAQPCWKRQMAAQNIIFHFELDIQDNPVLYCNATQMREALTNLILNAIHAMPDGGTITIRARKQAPNMIVTVSDTGYGMPPEVQQRCFEPFFSTKGREGGTGIGLAMAYGIVRGHEGRIGVESTENEGTTFTIHLPLSRPPPSKPEASAETPWPKPKSLRILIVDDEPWSRNFMSLHLRQEGHETAPMANGETSLEKFESKPFDLVITDRAMPDMSGDSLACRMKKIRPDIPILMVTGFGEIMKALGETPRGADAVLSKPVTRSDLDNAIAKIMATRSAQGFGDGHT